MNGTYYEWWFSMAMVDYQMLFLSYNDYLLLDHSTVCIYVRIYICIIIYNYIIYSHPGLDGKWNSQKSSWIYGKMFEHVTFYHVLATSGWWCVYIYIYRHMLIPGVLWEGTQPRDTNARDAASGRLPAHKEHSYEAGWRHAGKQETQVFLWKITMLNREIIMFNG